MTNDLPNFQDDGKLVTKMMIPSSQQQRPPAMLTRMAISTSQQQRVPTMLTRMAISSSQQKRDPLEKYRGITFMHGETSQQQSGDTLPRERRPQVHAGIVCNNCDGQVVGYRYKCQICASYNLCQNCRLQNKHSQHPMMLI